MLFDRAKGVMYELNESASAVVELLTTDPKPVGELVDALCTQFEAPREEIADDVQTFIDDFLEVGMLTTS
ncbi:PqqD family protein [Nocardia lijiangensis]|uniref:PqqD family protein n=1 Tax=Nocardia lijiangensis TaxID=299618 RepID=UPI003D72238F